MLNFLKKRNIFNRFQLLTGLLLVFLLSACETGRPFYEKSQRNWQNQDLPDPTGLSHIVFLIGDGGEPDLDPLEPNFRLLERELRAAGKNSSVIFLGDNIYPSGLPAEDHPDREEKEALINAQLDIVKDHPGGVYFIPGNHDWNRMKAYGLTAVRREEKYIESYLGDKASFYPNNGCGEPSAIEVNEDLTLILFDSQWWLHDWDKEDEIHQDCSISSREDLEAMLSELVDEYDDTNILICMHHPIHTQGSHGGFYSVKEHLFPLTYLSDGYLIPLPVLGSLHAAARYLGITRQDPSHPFYKDLIDAVEEATFRKDGVVIASGHEHNLEYFHEDEKHYIVSGSGSKSSYFKPGFDAEFGSGQEGFAKVYYYKDGSVWMEFLAAKPQKNGEQVIFRRKLKDPKLKAPRDPKQEFEDVWQNMPDTVGYIAAPNYHASESKRFWLGRNYRNAWTSVVKLPVLNMDTLIGGLTPLRKGGGRQSLAMRLEGSDGKEYVLRGLYKDATLSLPQFAQGTMLEDIYQDQMSMDHPYGATIIPPLADAVGVYHANPRFFYLPRQPRLGEFNDLFADQAYLFEERSAKNREDVASFGRSKDIESYRKMLKKTMGDHDHLIDQKHTLRSRLFDMLIGDWDRHDDQWRWATFKQGKKTIYRPVPRDRDHAFLSFRGILPWLVSRKWSVGRQLQSFNYDFYDIRGLNFNARFFDRQYLNEQDLADWIQVAEEIKRELSDEAIEKAVRLWPEPLFSLNGAEIITKLKSRRDLLPKVAATYYRFLAREVDIPGTNDQDLFEVSRMEGGKTRVQVFASNKEGEKKERWYDRTFDSAITKEIRLYGLKKDDIFLIGGKSGPNSLLRIIGGSGEDWIRDSSSVKGGKRTKVYDAKTEANRLELGKEAKHLTKESAYDNRYDRKDFKYPKTAPQIAAGINADDGLLWKFGITRTLQGFRKDPYKVKHSVLASYAFATQAISLDYSGDFIYQIGKWDVTLDAAFRAPTYVDNFFGLGNNTINLITDNDQFDFNRMRYGQIQLMPGLKKRLSLNTMKFEVQLHYTLTDVERVAGRISAPDNDQLSGLSDASFEPKHYAGLRIGYFIDKVNHPQNPTRGLRMNLTSSWNFNVKETQKNYLKFSTDLAVYYQPFSPFPFTIATRGGFASNVGQYEFFQANYLGRRQNLRGFNSNRFGGDRYLYGNFEGRLKLFKIKSLVLPAEIGIIGFYDTGRVWHESEEQNSDLNNWHKAWGGGAYMFAYDLLTLSANIAQSVEYRFFEFRLGFFF